jgi:hypothetical protein
VKLDNTSYPPTVILFFPSANCSRTTTTTSHDVTLILIRVFNHKQTIMKHYISRQLNLHCLHDLKYNTLSYNDIAMINETHTVIKLKTINYNPMCFESRQYGISEACSTNACCNRALSLSLNTGTGRSSVESYARSSPNAASYFSMNSGSTEDGSTSRLNSIAIG